MLYLALIFIFISVTTLTFYTLYSIIRKSDPTIKKLKDVDKLFRSNMSQQKAGIDKDDSDKKKKSQENLNKISGMISNISKPDEEKIRGLQKSLIQAGYRRQEHVQNFISLKISIAFIVFIGFLTITFSSGNVNLRVIIFGIMATLLGYLLPNLFLLLKIRQRQELIAFGLADALDFLVICVEAGLGMNSAITRVGKEITIKSPPLAQELSVLNQEMRTGISREQAFRNLADRNKVQDLKVLVGSIILSDRLGTNIAETLRAQSDSLRTRIRQRAEEQAAKAGVKMLFPLVIFILPALFLIMLGPGMLSFIETVLPAFQQ
jgi:tight adherence protein C